MIGGDRIMEITGIDDRKVWAGIRPEGFVLSDNGALCCGLDRVEVMGRDISVVCTHPAFTGRTIRAIINAESTVDSDAGTVRFDIRPRKLFLFDRESGERIRYEVR